MYNYKFFLHVEFLILIPSVKKKTFVLQSLKSDQKPPMTPTAKRVMKQNHICTVGFRNLKDS